MSLPLKLLLAAYALVSLLTFITYGVDKRRAVRHQWRVRESTLHWLELLGGWPGALAAQSAFKHKRAKPRYMAVFWAIVLLHAVAWLGVWWWRR